MSAGDRIPLAAARAIADELVTILGLGCERIEVAGSIRRGAPDVGDVELVAVPRLETVSRGFFETAEVSTLDLLLDTLIVQGTLTAPAVRGERYTKLHHAASGLQVDLFVVRPPACAVCGIIYSYDAASPDRHLRALRQGVHEPGLPPPPVLRPELQREGPAQSAGDRQVDRVGPLGRLEARRDDGRGIRSGSPPAAPRREREGADPGAQAGHGAAPASVPGAIREGSPPERPQDRQPGRQSPGSDPRASQRDGDLSALPAGVPDPLDHAASWGPGSQWGVIYLIRTGPAAYSQAFVTEARRRHFHVAGGALHRGGLGCGAEPCEVIDTPEEADVYRALWMPFVAPEDRR